MNEAVAVNIRLLRHEHSWTQEHLADATGLNPRTIQRAERGEGASVDTLMAVAAAFNVTVAVLQQDMLGNLASQFGVKKDELTPELVQRKLAEHQKEIEAKYILVPVARIAAPAAFKMLVGVHALNVESMPTISEEAQDLVAELKELLQDYVDVANDIGPVSQRETEKEAFALVQRLEALACAASIGAMPRRLQSADGKKTTLTFAYLVVTKADEVKDCVAIERGQPIQFV